MTPFWSYIQYFLEDISIKKVASDVLLGYCSSSTLCQVYCLFFFEWQASQNQFWSGTVMQVPILKA